MAGIARYGKILKALGHPKRQAEGGIPLLFEQYKMKLAHDDYLLAMFCLISLRPSHQGLARTIWRYIQYAEGKGLKVKNYIFEYAEVVYYDSMETPSHETRAVAHSKANRRKKSVLYKGEILALNIETKEEIILVGPEEMQALGFNATRVYDIVNNENSHVHKGYVFVRLIEDSEK